MLPEEAEDTTIYEVVVNHEGQYSIWPADRALPAGWRCEGKIGRKPECLAYIKDVWTDMRPLSLREKMANASADAASSATHHVPSDGQADEPVVGPTEDELVNRLISGDHPVEVSLRPERSIRRLKEAIDRGYVFLEFTDTRGGTELGIRIDPAASDWSRADFQGGEGVARLVGRLTLNYVKVRCIADIELAGLRGRGRLELEPI
jgi:uncharacterized protein YbdZ (MbtH family)